MVEDNPVDGIGYPVVLVRVVLVRVLRDEDVRGRTDGSTGCVHRAGEVRMRNEGDAERCSGARPMRCSGAERG
eukprot:5547563-Heterocapsa_arctica.AAC.1